MATPQEQAAFEAARRRQEEQRQQASGVGAVGSAANAWQMGKDMWGMANDAPAIAEGAGVMTPAVEGAGSGIGSGVSATAEGNAAWNASGMGVADSQAAWNAGAMEAGGAAPADAGVVSEAGAMGPLGYAASAAALLWGTYQLGKNWGDMSRKQGAMAGATAGAGAGAITGAIMGASYGGPIGAAIGAVVGIAASYITAGKHEDQKKRDAVRAAMVEQGMITPDFQLQLADLNTDGQPEYFNIGLDGGAREGYDFSGGRRPHEINTEHAYSVQATGWANPLAVVLANGDAKLTSNFAGYFANASMSNTDDIEGVRANMLQIMKDLKMTKGAAEASLGKLLNEGKIDKPHYDAYMASLNVMFSGDSKSYVTTPWNEFEAGIEQGQKAAEAEAQANPQAVRSATPAANVADPSGSGTFHAQADATAAEMDPEGQAVAAQEGAAAQERLRVEAANKAARLANEKANKVSVAQQMMAQNDPMSQLSMVAGRTPQAPMTNQAGTSAARSAIEAAKMRQQESFGRVYA